MLLCCKYHDQQLIIIRMATEDRMEFVVIIGLFLSITWLIIGLRCYVRIAMTKSFGLPDWLAIASLGFLSLLGALIIVGIRYGFSSYIVDPSPKAFEFLFLADLVYVPTTAVFKLSIGVFLTRIAINRSQICITYVVMGSVIVSSTMYFFFMLFRCPHISDDWGLSVRIKSSCISLISISDVTMAYSVTNIVADWTLGVLPIFVIWDLKVDPYTKICVALLLGVGALASTATVVRVVYIINPPKSDDLLSNILNITFWLFIECGVGIVAPAIATLKPLLLAFLSRTGLLRPSSNGCDTRSLCWPKRRTGHRRDNANGHDMDDLGLQIDIRNSDNKVATVTDSASPGDKDPSEQSIESMTAMGGGKGPWDEGWTKLDDDNVEFASGPNSNMDIWKTVDVTIHSSAK